MSALLDLAAIRASHPLPSIVGGCIKLQRARGEWKGCCPFHADKSPSFTIFDGGQRFHCFGCGADGDVVDFVRKVHGVGLRQAAAMLSANHLPAVVRALPPSPPKSNLISAAQAMWRAAGPIANTPAAAYLAWRGIDIRLPECLRFARLRYPGVSGMLPALVAAVASGDNTICGIQRTFVREDGRGKADVPCAKLSLGQISGGAIRLAPPAGELIVTGGIEDGLSLQQDLGRAVWAATGEGNMAMMILPAGVRSVTVGADRDPSGDNHARRAAEAFALQGRTARIIRPMPGHKDFNSELMGVYS